MAGILYISYDGMLEPLGQSQVISYLSYLSRDHNIYLISFEKQVDWNNASERQQLTERIASAGIIWHPLRYHKRPTAFATAWDILCGIVLGLWLLLRHQLNIVHARSYVASLIALVLKRVTGANFIFDMRGFWADERVDGGLWSRNGSMYFIAKRFERHFLFAADHLITLTHAAANQLQQSYYLQGCMPPFTVIPTCANLDRFKPSEPHFVKEKFVLGYVGSAGTWYLFDKAIVCFVELLRVYPAAKFLIVNWGQHDYIRKQLGAAGVCEKNIELIAATHETVPIHMAKMDAGIFFYRPSFSRLACSPTKLAEFLGCGIPCLSNAGVGDMAAVLEGDQVGVAIKAFDDESMLAALHQLIKLVNDPKTSARCVASARKHFSLDEGVRLYDKIYQSLS